MVRFIKNIIKKITYRFISPPICNYNHSFSQAGEDMIVDFLFQTKNISKPNYIELGIYMPVIGSNTYKFYNRGGKGVLVEADETLIDYIKRERKNDTILSCGVGVNGLTEADFYIFEIPAHNTFDKNEAEYRIKNGSYKHIKTSKVKLRSINDIIKENFSSFPDFLSIDIEGLDLQVLQSMNFDKYPIPVICAETCTYSENHLKPRDHKIEDFMKTKGYFIYGDTYINTIFVNYKWFNI